MSGYIYFQFERVWGLTQQVPNKKVLNFDPLVWLRPRPGDLWINEGSQNGGACYCYQKILYIMEMLHYFDMFVEILQYSPS